MFGCIKKIQDTAFTVFKFQKVFATLRMKLVVVNDT